MLFLLLLSFLLGVDSFVTCLSIGMCNPHIKKRKAFSFFTIIGLFHFFMPIVGFAFILIFKSLILPYGKYVSFAVFAFLGVKMILEGVRSFVEKEDSCDSAISLSFSSMLLLSFMLSVDAIVAGLSIPVMKLDEPLILFSLSFALFAFVMSAAGFYSGRYLSSKVGKYSNLIAGVLMIALAIKTLSF